MHKHHTPQRDANSGRAPPVPAVFMAGIARRPNFSYSGMDKKVPPRCRAAAAAAAATTNLASYGEREDFALVPIKPPIGFVATPLGYCFRSRFDGWL